MITYEIVFYNEIIKRDVVVFKSPNFDLVNKIYLMKYKDDLLMTFRFVIKIEN